MTYTVGENCIACNTCISICPVGAIHRGESIFIIDADKCVGCGKCADKCPAAAIGSDK